MNGREHTFGISGLLYKANVLLYDRETESLWSQIKRRAVTGKMDGTKLETVPSVVTTWKRWKKKHPKTLVLSEKTGFSRDYSKDPYRGYYQSPLPFGEKQVFAAIRPDIPHVQRIPQKELVLGVELGGKSKAYPFSTLKSLKGPIKDNFGGTEITVHFDAPSKEAYATDSTGKRIESIVTFWFVWFSFDPETLVFQADETGKPRN